jgi:hypothetical protein
MSMTVHRPFTITIADYGQKLVERSAGVRRAQEPAPEPPRGRVPRITRLMALAIKFDGYLRDGLVRDYAELARLGHVSRARITQIMDLNLLAPDIQRKVLELPRTVNGRDPVRERHLRPIAAEADWSRQREMWQCFNTNAPRQPLQH